MQTLEKYGVNYYNDSHGSVPCTLFQRAGMPIYIIGSFFGGSQFDVIPGTAHFLEHMLVAGTKKYPSKKQLSITLEELGGVFGAYTQQDFLRMNVEIAERGDISVGMDVLNEMVNNPLFDDQTFENERGAILSEYHVRKSNPQSFIWDVYSRLFFQGTEFSHSIIGTEESIKNISKQDVLDYYHNIFLKNPVSWIVAGDLDYEELEKGLNAVSQNENGRQTILSSKTLPKIREEKIDVEIYEGKNTSIIFGFRTEPVSQTNAQDLDILLNYLAMGRSATLVEELRYKKGLVYSVGGYKNSSLGLGAWSISTNFNAEHAQEVIDTIVREIKKVLEFGIPENDLVFVKNKLIKSNLRKMQTAKDWVTNHCSASFLTDPERYLVTNYEKLIATASAQSINDTARKYFTEDNWYLAICGPESLKNIEVNF